MASAGFGLRHSRGVASWRRDRMAVEAVLEFGEVAGYMLVADGAVSASDGALDVAEGGVDPLESRVQGGLATGSSDDRLVNAAGVADPVKQCRPSLTTVLAGWKLRCAKVAISARRKPFTRRNFKRIGLPSGVVSPPPRSASCQANRGPACRLALPAEIASSISSVPSGALWRPAPSSPA